MKIDLFQIMIVHHYLMRRIWSFYREVDIINYSYEKKIKFSFDQSIERPIISILCRHDHKE